MNVNNLENSLKFELKQYLLPAPFINKGFVKGDSNCDPEKYLLELINESLFFLRKSNFEFYHHPENESHGECDCISSDYMFDLKMMISCTRMHSSKELSAGKFILAPGVVATTEPNRPNTSMKVIALHVLIRNKSYEDLTNFEFADYEYGTEERELDIFLRNLQINKNLFLFYPFTFYFDKQYNFRYAVNNIINILENDLYDCMKYRFLYRPDCDIYFSFIYDDHLIICEINKEFKFKFVDSVYLFKSETYKNLYNKYF